MKSITHNIVNMYLLDFILRLDTTFEAKHLAICRNCYTFVLKLTLAL